MTNNTVAARAARIAESTWERLRKARDPRVRLGEETLTDLLVLDFLMSVPRHKIDFLQTTKHDEPKQGTDLVVCVRRGTKNADIYAIQAKKLSAKRRYDHLHPRSGDRHQIDILEDYATRAKGVVPLYLLFNHVDDKDLDSTWQCCQTMDKRQFGCTLVPSWRIRDAISKRGCRTFNYIHSDRAALPWRCAFACPKGQTMWDQIREKARESYRERFSQNFPSSEEAGLRVRNRQAVLSSFPYDQYANMDFSSGLGVWPSDLWDRGPSSPLVDDIDLNRLYGGSAIEAVNRLRISPLPPPRWLVLVNSDDS